MRGWAVNVVLIIYWIVLIDSATTTTTLKPKPTRPPVQATRPMTTQGQ